MWPLGEVERAREMIERMSARLSEIDHAATAAYASLMAAMFELMRRDFARAEPHARTLARLAHEHDMEQWKAFGIFVEGWLAWRGGDRVVGLAGMRRGLAELDTRKIVARVVLFEAVLAEAEAEAGAFQAALASLDAAIIESDGAGRRWYDAELHRIRGEILIKQTPTDPAPAEAASLIAIAIAQSQKARSFELRAALSLAELRRFAS
jgi:predicted ATPase